MPRTLIEGLGFVLGFWFALAALAPPAQPSPLARSGSQDPELARLEASLHEAVNAWRSDRKLILLERRADLDAVARAHSADMAARHYLSHHSPEGAMWVDRLRRAAVDGFALAGENVGLTSRSDPNREILEGWIRSPIHRENLAGRPYNATGIGVARGVDGTLYYTQLYLTFPR